MAGIVLVGATALTACSGKVDDAVDGVVDDATEFRNKAAACTEALGIVTSFDPEMLDPERLQQEAVRKADQVRELAGRVADADLRQSLFGVADGYVELKRREAEGLAGINDWLQRNADNLDRIRQICL